MAKHLRGPVIAAALLLGGCACKSKTVEVEVPVPVHSPPPVELLAPIDTAALPTFVAPGDPRASSGLTPEGERRLKQLLLDLFTRVEAWQAWGATP